MEKLRSAVTVAVRRIKEMHVLMLAAVIRTRKSLWRRIGPPPLSHFPFALKNNFKSVQDL